MVFHGFLALSFSVDRFVVAIQIIDSMCVILVKVGLLLRNELLVDGMF